jgi:hypothetical protein
MTPADTTEKVTPLTSEDVAAIAAKPSGFHPGPPGLKSESSSEESKSDAKEP